jgi:recombinational DNA repair ATPase RecF
VLEGFDFGVGMLSLAIGRDDVDRRLARNAIGPVWDGNEVWLIVAGGATFAAFPLWYASMFSGRPVLLLDEATSHLDAAAASAVLAVVLEHAADRSLLWVTHRQEELAFFPEVRSLDTVPG